MYSLKDDFKITSIRILSEHWFGFFGVFFSMQFEKTGRILILWWHSGAGNSRDSSFMWIKLVSLWLHLAMLELLCSLLPSPFLLGYDVVGRASPRKRQTKEYRLVFHTHCKTLLYMITHPTSRNRFLFLIKKSSLRFWQNVSDFALVTPRN